jgi:hypothetical protein
MNDLGIRADGNILGDGTEARASFGETGLQVGFVGELVLEHIQIGHAEGVLAGGLEKSSVPAECGEALCGALVVQCVEKLTLGIISLQLRARARTNEQ